MARSDLRPVTRLIEGVIEDLGLSSAEARLSEFEHPAWCFDVDQVAVFVFLNRADDGNYLQVVSALTALPRSGRMGELYTRLLELNADELMGAFVGIKDEQVVITCDRRTLDISRTEVREMIDRVAGYAASVKKDLAAYGIG
jgi:hypothetical protein